MSRILRVSVVLLAGATGIAGQGQPVWQQLREAGQAALDRGDLPRAELQWVSALDPANIGGRNDRLAASQIDLAGLYTIEGRLFEAQALLRDAQTSLQRAGTDSTSDYAWLMAAGQLHIESSEFSQADGELNSALKAARSGFGPDHPRTAAAYSALGELKLREYAPAEAADSLRLAAGILAEIYGPRNAAVVEAQARQARLLLMRGRYVESAAMARPAVDAAEKMGPAGGLCLPDALLALGLADAALGRSGDATVALSRAVTKGAEVFGRGLRLPRYYTALADATLATGQPSRAGEIAAVALSLAKSDPMPDWLPEAEALATAARIAIALQKSPEAGTDLQQALAIAGKRLGPDNLFLADLMELRGDLYLSLKDMNSASGYYRQALASRENKLTPGHPDVARSLVDMARMYQAQNQPDTAESMYLKAIRLLENAWKNDCFCLVPTLQSYEGFLRQQNRTREAQDIGDRVTNLQVR
jgi:Tfp pilus assembly protein PilF